MSFGFSLGDFIAVGQLAWKLYKSCKAAGGAFEELSHEVIALHTAIKELEDEIENPDSILNRTGAGKKSELEILVNNCRSVLQQLHKLLTKYTSLGTGSKRAWDRLKWGTENLQDIREKVMINRSSLTLFLTTLGTSSLGRIEKKLDQLIQDVRNGKREETVITLAIADNDPDESEMQWGLLKEELFEDGFSKLEIEGHKHWIKAKLSEMIAIQGLNEQPLGKGTPSSAEQESTQPSLYIEKDGSTLDVLSPETTRQHKSPTEKEKNTLDSLNAEAMRQRKSPQFNISKAKLNKAVGERAKEDDENSKEDIKGTMEGKQPTAEVQMVEEDSDGTDETFHVLPTDSISQIGTNPPEPSRSRDASRDQSEARSTPNWKEDFETNALAKSRQKSAGPSRGHAQSSSRSRGKSPINTQPIDSTLKQPQEEGEPLIQSPTGTKLTFGGWAPSFKPKTFTPAQTTMPHQNWFPPVGDGNGSSYEEHLFNIPLSQLPRSNNREQSPDSSSIPDSHRAGKPEATCHIVDNGRTVPANADRLPVGLVDDTVHAFYDRFEISRHKRSKERPRESIRQNSIPQAVYYPQDLHKRPPFDSGVYHDVPLTRPNDFARYGKQGPSVNHDAENYGEGGYFPNTQAVSSESPQRSQLKPRTGGTSRDYVESFGSPPKYQNELSRSPTPPPTIVEHPLLVTLEELFHGCHKKTKIRVKIFDKKTGHRGILDKSLEVEIMPGLRKGSKFKFKECGEQDLHLIVEEKEHLLYTRENDDIHMTLELSLIDSLCGFRREITTIDGQKVIVDRNSPTEPESEDTYPGLGMPNVKQPEERGKFIVKYKVRYPQTLSKIQKSKIRRILLSDSSIT